MWRDPSGQNPRAPVSQDSRPAVASVHPKVTYTLLSCRGKLAGPSGKTAPALRRQDRTSHIRFHAWLCQTHACQAPGSSVVCFSSRRELPKGISNTSAVPAYRRKEAAGHCSTGTSPLQLQYAVHVSTVHSKRKDLKNQL
jgi:hypothetical protein